MNLINISLGARGRKYSAQAVKSLPHTPFTNVDGRYNLNFDSDNILMSVMSLCYYAHTEYHHVCLLRCRARIVLIGFLSLKPFSDINSSSYISKCDI